MILDMIQGRAFLDTCSVNFILDNGEYIFENIKIDDNISERIKNDIEAFKNIFITGRRASWQLAVSPLTYTEIIKTNNPERKRYLEIWFNEVYNYWLEILNISNDLPSFVDAEKIKTDLLSSGRLDKIPGTIDRLLICDAVVYRCDFFCTRDYKTILKFRNDLRFLNIDFISPSEWWSKIEPYATLWA